MRSVFILVAAAGVAALAPAGDPVGAARQALAGGRTDDAIGLLRRATADEPGHAAAHNMLGSLLNSSGHYAEALPHAETAVRLDPGNARYRYNRGVVRAEHGRFQDAIADFDVALASHPELTYGWLERGAAKLALDDAAGARADWGRAATVDPKLIWVRWYQATGDFVEGKYAAAAAGFDAVAAAEPGFVPAKLWQTAAHVRSGAPLVVPDPKSGDWPAPVLRFLHRELSEADLLKTAMEDRVSGDQRRLGEAHFFLGLNALKMGDRARASQSFERALQVKAPRHVWKIAAERELARLRD